MTSSSPQLDTDKNSDNLVLDQPRERKAVDRYVDTRVTVLKKRGRQVTAKGTGVPISDMERVCQRLDKMRGADELLKLLHRALYGRPGTAHHVKQGIRIWNGLPTVTDGKDEVDPEAAKLLMGQLERWLLEPLHEMCHLFGLVVKRNKKDCLDTLYRFLCKPWNTDKSKQKRKARTDSNSETKSTVKKARKTSKITDESEGTNQSDGSASETEEEEKTTVKKAKSTLASKPKKQSDMKRANSSDKSGKTVASKEKKATKSQDTKESEKQSSTKAITVAKPQKSDKSINKKTLEVAIRKIISESNLETMTSRNVREELSVKFKRDMTEYKSEIKRIVNDIVMDMVNK